jgi:hypothetical protein
LNEIYQAWENQFRDLFERLGLPDTRKFVDDSIDLVEVQPRLEDYMLGGVEAEDTSDLAD